MNKHGTCIDELMASYHAEVWAAAENGGAAYDEAGEAIAKDIVAKVAALEDQCADLQRDLEAERHHRRAAEESEQALLKDISDCSVFLGSFASGQPIKWTLKEGAFWRDRFNLLLRRTGYVGQQQAGSVSQTKSDPYPDCELECGDYGAYCKCNAEGGA